jgi:hypothetical protein
MACLTQNLCLIRKVCKSFIRFVGFEAASLSIGQMNAKNGQLPLLPHDLTISSSTALSRIETKVVLKQAAIWFSS